MQQAEQPFFINAGYANMKQNGFIDLLTAICLEETFYAKA